MSTASSLPAGILAIRVHRRSPPSKTVIIPRASSRRFSRATAAVRYGPESQEGLNGPVLTADTKLFPIRLTLPQMEAGLFRPRRLRGPDETWCVHARVRHDDAG